MNKPDTEQLLEQMKGLGVGVDLDSPHMQDAISYIRDVYRYAKSKQTKAKVSMMAECMHEQSDNDREFMAILLTMGEAARDVLEEGLGAMLHGDETNIIRDEEPEDKPDPNGGEDSEVGSQPE